MMTGRKKLYFLLNCIDDARELAPSGQPLKIHATHDLGNKYREIELDQLFTKLEKDEKIIRIIKHGNRLKEAGAKYGLNEPDDGCFQIELLPIFKDYFTKIQNEPEYQKFSGRRPVSQQKTPSIADFPFYTLPFTASAKNCLRKEHMQKRWKKDLKLSEIGCDY